MTMPDDRRGPVDVAALAELDAGLPEPAEAARRRAALEKDPDAAAVLDALAATRAELAALPVPEVPPAVAARWRAALAAEAGRAAAPPAIGDRPDRRIAPRGRSARDRSGRRLLAAAAVTAVVAGAGAGALLHPPEPPAPAVWHVELVALARGAVGTMDVGGLADPARRRACLRAVAPAAVDETLLGGRRVVLDGRSGVLLVLSTGRLGEFRIVVVDPSCGPEEGSLIAQLVVA